jgi:hypothetical protein
MSHFETHLDSHYDPQNLPHSTSESAAPFLRFAHFFAKKRTAAPFDSSRAGKLPQGKYPLAVLAKRDEWAFLTVFHTVISGYHKQVAHLGWVLPQTSVG